LHLLARQQEASFRAEDANLQHGINMKARPSDFVFIFLTIAFTVYGQLMVKSRVTALGVSFGAGHQPMQSIGKLLLDPGVLSGLAAGFVAALCWMAALSKFQLSYAYPFTSLSFVLVLLLSAYMLKEPVTVPRVIGVALIVAGTIVAAKS
jgi:uncharacterized membrane protein